jgi:hypothetical protein
MLAPQPFSKITTLPTPSPPRYCQSTLHTRVAAHERPKADGSQIQAAADIPEYVVAQQVRPRFSTHSCLLRFEAVRIKRNWDSTSASRTGTGTGILVPLAIDDFMYKNGTVENFPTTSKPSLNSQSGCTAKGAGIHTHTSCSRDGLCNIGDSVSRCMLAQPYEVTKGIFPRSTL